MNDGIQKMCAVSLNAIYNQFNSSKFGNDCQRYIFDGIDHYVIVNALSMIWPHWNMNPWKCWPLPLIRECQQKMVDFGYDMILFFNIHCHMVHASNR